MSKPSFFAELKRRHVYKVGATYAIAGWLLVQFATQVFPFFNVPNSAVRLVVILVGIGFPIALIVSWVYDLTPEGLVRTDDLPSADSPPQVSARRSMDRKLNYVLGGLLILALGYFMVDRFVLSRAAPAVIAVAPPSATTRLAVIGPSIAVLPFTDLSQAGDQTYFSDGMSEELLNLLAQVPGLHVAGRTSSFTFKGKSATIVEIGAALNVTTVLEGSVRKAGDRLRVTAQLVNVADGYHLWSQSYDRKLTDIFAIQDDIAGAVVDALKLKLLPGQRPSSAKHHVPSFEIYNHYLLGRQLLVRNTGEGSKRAVEAFGRAVASDPDYAAAYAGLAMAESFAVEDSPDASNRAQGDRRAMAAAEQAVALDPELGDAYAARGYLRGTNEWDWDGALADLVKAVTLDPGEARNRQRYGNLLATLGRLSEASVAFVKATELDPRFAPAWGRLGRVKAAQTDYDGARLALQRALAIDPDYEIASFYLGIVSLLQGDATTAREVFAKQGNWFGLALAEHTLSRAKRSRQALDKLIAQRAWSGAYQIAAAYAWRGDSDQAFTWLGRAVEQHDVNLIYLKYDPLLRSLRDDARYAALLRKLKLPE